MAEKIYELGSGMELWNVHPDDLREQDENARVMPKNMFEHLTRTIGKEGRLESLPFCAKTKRGIEIVSGHHRVRAARDAELTEIFVLVDTSGLSRDEIKAKQLAHNAIQGEDDPEILRRIYEAIEDVDARIESFIDADELADRLRGIEAPNMDIGMEYRTAMVTFLPYEKDRFDRAVEELTVELDRQAETVYMAELELLERFREILERVGKEYEVRAMGSRFRRMAEIVLDYLGDPDPVPEPLPVRDVIGSSVLDQEEAEIVGRALRRIQSQNGLASRRQALVDLAGRYLEETDE